ncbi:hypothetical protein BKA70DRAFT_1420014 [Coprinopsis sp. MPI-PUGE-AT-0042]|nr:hypothetical protein BKA70DRAFT_1420014 [Coprinopsis sp. MPI-PUGE-AT-0042]
MAPGAWETLLEPGDEPLVKPLKDGEAWKAANTWRNAFVHDPLTRYLQGDQPETPRSIKTRKLFIAGVLLGWIRVHNKVVITVNGGESLVIANLAQSSVGRGSLKDRLINWLIETTFKYKSFFASRESKMRRKEFAEKRAAVMKDTIGDRSKDMILVSLVCTDPESRGHGYASALLATITRIADSLETACWLESSNILNEPFYNSHGFKTIGEAVIGDQNPTWREKAFPMQFNPEDMDPDQGW